MHAQISGTVDFREPDDDACILRIRALVDKIGAPNASPFSHVKPREPTFPRRKISTEIFSSDPGKQYDHARNHRPHCGRERVRGISGGIRRNTPCGYARIGGWAVGIVANQKKHVQTLARGSDQKRIDLAA